MEKKKKSKKIYINLLKYHTSKIIKFFLSGNNVQPPAKPINIGKIKNSKTRVIKT